MSTNSTPIPSPYIATPTQQWDGNDGKWSSFCISVGEPGLGQDFRVLVSTRGSALLDLENNLEFHESMGMYGLDTIRLGFNQEENALVVNNTQVVGFTDQGYSYMGLLGMSNAESSISNTDKPMKSLIQTLKDNSQIPSLSYGYTAGAYYRNKNIPGSLVIGGYDQSRFESPPYNFTFNGGVERPLLVGIQAISTNFSLTTPGAYYLTSNGHQSAIDSTVPHLWLPRGVCDNFAKALNLTYDEDQNYYLIDDMAHEKLLEENPTFTFQLGKDLNTRLDSININLPYAAFDLSVGTPVYGNATRYFPIRRASNETQYTIGRAFLQEAYLIVDYERQNFSLAQASVSETTPPSQIRTIFSTDYVPPVPTSSLSSGAKAGIAKAGIAIGALAGLLILFGALYLCWYRPRRTEQVRRQREASVVSAAPPYTENAIPPNYAEGKPYNPFYATGGPEQPPSEMLASTGHQGPRPELEGAGVGGGSYELPASAGAAREGRLHEMDAGNGDAAGGKGDGEEGTERERRTSAAVAPTER
ncbi:acid protease [Neofusicoccum parvum]|uniref:Acid protease n=1 Tax=Neofusicoccum parvum TaxID=310453 RepID=A0ACB5SMN4_9PEZI|nr:acid protease [Neofusicoccum parvum]